MPVGVSYCKLKGTEHAGAPSIHKCRHSELLTPPATTTKVAEDGEVAYVVNGETDIVFVAHGRSPDASKNDADLDTNAGYCVPAGDSLIIVLDANDKVDVKPHVP